MKQNITLEQLNQLSSEAKERLAEWYWNKQGIVGFKMYKDNGNTLIKEFKAKDAELRPEDISMGQMLEFIQEDGLEIKRLPVDDKDFPYGWYVMSPTISKQFSFICDDELIDCLWEAVKIVLKDHD